MASKKKAKQKRYMVKSKKESGDMDADTLVDKERQGPQENKYFRFLEDEEDEV